MAYIYIDRWKWAERNGKKIWLPPGEGAIGCLDLRSHAEMSSPGLLSGLGVFVYKAPQNSMLYEFGMELKAEVPLQKLQSLKTDLKLKSDLAGTSFDDVLWEVLTVQADPTGRDGSKPILPGPDRMMRLYLGGFGLVREEKLVPFQSKEWANVLEVERENYRRLKTLSLLGSPVGIKALGKRIFDPNEYRYIHRKYLTVLQKKYGVKNYRIFISPGLPDEKPLPHNTTITENWNCANSDSISCNQTWVEVLGDLDIVSNQIVSTGLNQTSRAYCTTALSSDDHYSQVVITSLPKPVTADRAISARIYTRYSTLAVTNYSLDIYYWEDGTQDLGVNKSVDDVETNFGWDYVTLSIPDTIKLSSDGSTIKGYMNGVEICSGTDSSITGNLLTGLGGYNRDDQYTLDDFEAADLAAPSAAITGTITDSITEADIVAGGKTIVITLTGDEWIPT